MTRKHNKDDCIFFVEKDEKCALPGQIETFEAMFNAISDAIVLADIDRKITRVNKGMEYIFGYTIDDLKGKSSAILYASEQDYLHQGEIRFNLSAKEKKKPYEVYYRRKNGEIFPGETIGTVVKNSDGKIIEYIGVIRDISERKQAQDEIQRLAMTDQLTGLGNRYQFNRRFDESLKLAAREGNRLALIMLDLNKFKLINDSFGHLAGDAVLEKVATVLQDNCREIDVVARLGGDEFAILLIHPEETQNVKVIIERIADEMKNPVTILDNKVVIGASIGIAIYPDDATNKDNLIRKADLALYEAKKSESDDFIFYRDQSGTE
jgi:diguanylate cyclase (GGDEF)-like protein/PAS domain S-box-containing protein